MRTSRGCALALAFVVWSAGLAACVEDPLAAEADLLPFDQSIGTGDLLVDGAGPSELGGADLGLGDLSELDLGLQDLAPEADLQLPIARWRSDGRGLEGGDIKRIDCPETNRCFAATSRAIYLTADGATSWVPAPVQPPLTSGDAISTIVAHPPDGSVLTVLTKNRIYRRPNSLAGTPFDDLGAAPGAFAEAVVVAINLYGRLPAGQLYEFTLSGGWNAIAAPSSDPVQAIAAPPGTLELWAGAASGVWSRDLASTDLASPGWQQRYAPPGTAVVAFDASTSPPSWVAKVGNDYWLSPTGAAKCPYTDTVSAFLLSGTRLVVRADGGYFELAPSTCQTGGGTLLDANLNSLVTTFVRVPDAGTTLLGYGTKGVFHIGVQVSKRMSGLEAAHITGLAAPSSTEGALWVATSAGLFERKASNVYFEEVQTPHKLFRSFDGVAAIGQHVLATSSGAELTYSIDGGLSWGLSVVQPADLGGATSLIASGPVAMVGSGTVAIACGLDGKTYRTSDGGATFVPISAGTMPLDECLAVVRHPTSDTFYLSAAKTVWRGDATGTSWTRLYDGQLAGMNSLAPDPFDADAVYVVASALLHLKGATSGIVNGTGATAPHQVVTDGSNLFVVDDDGVVRLQPFGAWLRLATGFPAGSVATVLLPNPANPNGLYLGTKHSGLLAATGVWP